MRIVLPIGMILSGVLNAMMGASKIFNIHSHIWFIIFWGSNGFIQSCGWPINVAIMVTNYHLFLKILYSNSGNREIGLDIIHVVVYMGYGVQMHLLEIFLVAS